jgi:hypothetical protein
VKQRLEHWQRLLLEQLISKTFMVKLTFPPIRTHTTVVLEQQLRRPGRHFVQLLLMEEEVVVVAMRLTALAAVVAVVVA